MQSSDEEQGQSLNSIVNRYQRPQRSDPSRSLDNSSRIPEDPLVNIRGFGFSEQQTYVNKLRAFVDRYSRVETERFQSKLTRLLRDYSRINQARISAGRDDLDISYIRFSHFIFDYNCQPNLQPEEIRRIEARINAFTEQDLPDEDTYRFLLKILRFLSKLMVK